MLAWYSLIHLAASELPDALAALARPLAPGGWLVVALHAGSEVRHHASWFDVPIDLDFVLHDPEVVALVEAAGLVDVEWYLRGPFERPRRDHPAALRRRPEAGLTVRVLFSSTSGYGHVIPMLPLADAFREARHDVLWATAAQAMPLVAAAGVEAVASGASGPEEAAIRSELRTRADRSNQPRAAVRVPPDVRRGVDPAHGRGPHGHRPTLGARPARP